MKNINNLWDCIKLEKTGNGHMYNCQDNRPDIQDCIMNTARGELFIFFNGLDNELKRIFLHVVALTLDYNTFTDIVKQTVLKKEFETRHAELQAEYVKQETALIKQGEKINKQITDYKDMQKPIHKRITALKNEIAHLKAENNYRKARDKKQSEAVYVAQEQVRMYAEKSAKLDALKDVLAGILQ